MKNKILVLTRILLKNGGGYGLKKSKSGASQVWAVALFLIFGLGFMVGVAFTMSMLYDALAPIGQQGIILSWSLAANAMAIFFFGIFYIMSAFYFASDIESLLPLPLRPKQIVGAKFFSIMVYEYLISAIIFLPAFIIFGVRSGAGVVYYLYGLITFFLIPVVPLVFSSLLVMVLMRFTNVSRHKDTIKMIAGFVAICLALGVNVFIQRFSTNLNAESLMKMVQQGNNSLVSVTSGIFPTVNWAVQALLQSGEWAGLIQIVLYTAVSIAVFMALLYLGELIYLKGVMGSSETSSKRNKLSHDQMAVSLVKSSVVKAYTMIELRLLFRTPIYFLNCVLIQFLWPVILLLPVFAQSSTNSEIMDEFFKLLATADSPGTVVLGAFAFFLFIGGVNGVPSTAISREGDSLYIKKYIPVDYRVQITAKLLSGIALGAIGMVIMIVTAVFIFKLSLLMALSILVTGALAMITTALSGILLDLYNPKLVWDTEQQAVKQNMNVVYNMFIAFALAGLTVLSMKLSLDLPAAVVFLLVVFGGISWILYRIVYTKGAARFAKL